MFERIDIFNHMVEQNAEPLDRVFHALADPTRRRMIDALVGRPRTVTELAKPFESTMSLAAASKHVKVLEGADLIRRSVQGRVHLCSLNAAPLHAVESWVGPYALFWTERLDALDDLIATDGDLA